MKPGGFEKISVSDGFLRKKLLKSGAELLKADHLKWYELKEIEERTSVSILGSCVPEMSVWQALYKIEFVLGTASSVKDARCSCVAGVNDQCKHSASLCLFINQERSTSQTDEVQKWKQPSRKTQSLYPKGETIEKLFDLPSIQCPSFKMHCPCEMQKVADQMEVFGLTDRGLYKSLTIDKGHCEEGDSMSTLVSVPLEVQAMLQNEILIPCWNREPNSYQEETFLITNVLCSTQKAEAIFSESLGQDTNKMWSFHRKYRISVSMARQIAHAKVSN